jgi:DNA adenine methylase
LLKVLRHYYPKEYGTYYEPFLGAGSVFFDLMPKKAVLSDIDPYLIAAFRGIRDWPEEVNACLASYPALTKEFYVEARKVIPSKDAALAAWLITMNRCVWHHVYVVDPATGYKGGYGYFYGGHLSARGPHAMRDYRVIDMVPPEDINEVSRALRNAELEVASWETIMPRIKSGDFVYFDPPYDMAEIGGAYKNNFVKADQLLLAQKARDLAREGVYVLASNSKTEMTEQIWSGYPFSVYPVRVSKNLRNDIKAATWLDAEIVATNVGATSLDEW